MLCRARDQLGADVVRKEVRTVDFRNEGVGHIRLAADVNTADFDRGSQVIECDFQWYFLLLLVVFRPAGRKTTNEQ